MKRRFEARPKALFQVVHELLIRRSHDGIVGGVVLGELGGETECASSPLDHHSHESFMTSTDQQITEDLKKACIAS